VGLLDSLFGGGGHSQTTQSTSTVTNTQLSGGNVDAPVVYGSGNYQVINATDGGAIQSATDISKAALDLGRSESLAGSAVAIAGLDHATDAYTSSLQLARNVSTDALHVTSAVSGKALDSLDRFSAHALDNNTFIAGKSLDSVSAAYADSMKGLASGNAQALKAVENSQGGVLDFARSIFGTAIQANENLQGSAIAGNAQLADQVSQSATQSVNDSLVKIAMYAALAFVAIAVLRKAH
jgi:hypothetical protein